MSFKQAHSSHRDQNYGKTPKSGNRPQKPHETQRERTLHKILDSCSFVDTEKCMHSKKCANEAKIYMHASTYLVCLQMKEFVCHRR